MKNTRPTIYDLARLMDVSPGTISRAFNQNPQNRINPETKERILAKAREIGYFPNTGARAIISGQAGRWGLLLPHLYNPRYVELMDHLDHEAHKRGTTLFLGLGRYDRATEERIVSHWASGEVDGIIADASTHYEVFETLQKRGFPLVFLYGRAKTNFDMIDIELMSTFRALMEKLLEQGHRCIGFVSENFPEYTRHPSYRGYAEGLADYGIPLDPSLIALGSHDYTAGAEAWGRWRKNPPTAVLCFNDVIACNLIENVRADGLKVPSDISVTGSDDIAAAATYGLTTIRTDPAEIAVEVFQLLEEPSKKGGRSRVVNSKIVDRESVGPVPAGRKKRAGRGAR